MIGSCVWTAMLASMAGNPFVKILQAVFVKEEIVWRILVQRDHSHLPGQCRVQGREADDFTL
jgi:hypothetical protein